MDAFRETYLRDILRTYRNYKALGERAIAQTPDPHLHAELDSNSNSIAVIVKHLSGNLCSRFQDFLTSDGEKPDRDRDGEFEMTQRASRAEIVGWWERGWETVLKSVEALRPEDLDRTILIRREPLSVPSIARSPTRPITWARSSTSPDTSRARSGRRSRSRRADPGSTHKAISRRRGSRADAFDAAASVS